MVRLTRGNVIAVTVATAIIGMLAHLDGAGATTFLLTIPALLPLYKQLRMSPYLMLLLLALGAGIFNIDVYKRQHYGSDIDRALKWTQPTI